MHIPDGLLDTKTTVLAAAVSLPVLTYAARRVKKELDDKYIPVTAAMAAFVFIAQMINFPISAGTSGHLIGAFLLTFLIGPWLSMLTITLVLLVQAFLFQDGGILALPANILNMAVIAPLAAVLWIKLFSGTKSWLRHMRIVPGAIFSLVCMSFVGAMELWMSGLFEFRFISSTLVSAHLIVGLGEGFISLMIIRFVQKVKPELTYAS